MSNVLTLENGKIAVVSANLSDEPPVTPPDPGGSGLGFSQLPFEVTTSYGFDTYIDLTGYENTAWADVPDTIVGIVDLPELSLEEFHNGYNGAFFEMRTKDGWANVTMKPARVPPVLSDSAPVYLPAPCAGVNLLVLKKYADTTQRQFNGVLIPQKNQELSDACIDVINAAQGAYPQLDAVLEEVKDYGTASSFGGQNWTTGGVAYAAILLNMGSNTVFSSKTKMEMANETGIVKVPVTSTSIPGGGNISDVSFIGITVGNNASIRYTLTGGKLKVGTNKIILRAVKTNENVFEDDWGYVYGVNYYAHVQGVTKPTVSLPTNGKSYRTTIGHVVLQGTATADAQLISLIRQDGLRVNAAGGNAEELKAVLPVRNGDVVLVETTPNVTLTYFNNI